MKSKQFGLIISASLAAVLIFLLLTLLNRWTSSAYASPASSNPATQLEFASSLGGSITSVAVSGTIAYMGQGGTFATFDISDPTQISRLAYLLLPNPPSFAAKIQVVGSLAYIASGNLQIVDVSDPLNPELLGSYAPGGSATDLEVVGTLAYLLVNTPSTSSLQILDVTNPAIPTDVGSYSPGANYFSMDIENSFAYLMGYGGFKIIDVQDPANPVPQGSFSMWDFFSEARDVQVEGSLAIIVGDESHFYFNGQLLVLDVSNPLTPTLVSLYEGIRSDPWVVKSAGNFAYVGGAYGLDIVDLTTPMTPTLSSSYPFEALDLQIIDSRAYLAGGSAGMQILDVSSPANPTPLGSYELLGSVTDIEVQLSYIYTTGGIRELTILDGTDPTSPLALTSPITPGHGRDLKVIEDLAYINRYNYGFDIFDVTDPTSPTLLSRYNPSHGSYTAMTVEGDYAYIGELLGGDLATGINILNISNPANPQYLGRATNISGSGPQAMKVAGNLIYTAAGNGGLVIVDAGNPASPNVIGRYEGLWAEGIDVAGTLAYVIDNTGLSIFDVNNPNAPVFLSNYANSNLMEVQVVNDLAYVGTTSGLLIIDVSNPLAPVLQEQYTLSCGVGNLAITDDFIYLACGWGGLRIFYFSSPDGTATPRPPTSTRTPKPPSSTPTPSSTPQPPSLTPTSSYTPLPPSSTPTPSSTPIPSPTATIKPLVIYKLYLPFILR